jgi:hypothetical protein
MPLDAVWVRAIILSDVSEETAIITLNVHEYYIRRPNEHTVYTYIQYTAIIFRALRTTSEYPANYQTHVQATKRTSMRVLINMSWLQIFGSPGPWALSDPLCRGAIPCQQFNLIVGKKGECALLPVFVNLCTANVLIITEKRKLPRFSIFNSR